MSAESGPQVKLIMLQKCPESWSGVYWLLGGVGLSGDRAGPPPWLWEKKNQIEWRVGHVIQTQWQHMHSITVRPR